MAEVNVLQTKYSLKAVLETGQTVNLTGLVLSMSISDPPEEIAQRATIRLANTKTSLGYVSDIIKLCTMLFAFAGQEEIFRGKVWEWEYQSALQKEITLTAYNNIIYATKSKVNSYFTGGQSTADIMGSICGEWGIGLNYEYDSITHNALKFAACTLSEAITRLMDEAESKLTDNYCMYMDKDILQVKKFGSNQDVFMFHARNVIQTTDRLTLDGLVTMVHIIGRSNENGIDPIENVVPGNTEYGDLIEFMAKDSNRSLGEINDEAKKLLQERGIPRESISIMTPDVPQIRKGYKIKVTAGNLSGYFYVRGVSHDTTTRTMAMEVERVWK